MKSFGSEKNRLRGLLGPMVGQKLMEAYGICAFDKACQPGMHLESYLINSFTQSSTTINI